MTVRGIRGATTIEQDTTENVLSATRELLQAIFTSNPELRRTDIASAIFTTTTDVVSVFPAVAARQIGWDMVPMICTHEIPVPDSLPHCIRVLLHWNTEQKQEAIQHVYLHAAKSLRLDLSPNLVEEKEQ